MPQLQAQDFVNFARILTATPGNTGQVTRWNDTQMVSLVDRAVKHAVGEIFFPESRVTFLSQANVQEYPTDPRGLGVHQIKRVYVNGQLASPSNIETLIGAQTDNWDQSGSGSATLGSGAPIGTGGGGQPQMSIATPITPPYLNSWGAPRPSAASFFPGQPPRFYTRGGVIGIVPMVVGAWIAIDCVLVPATLTKLTDAVVVPDNFMEAVSWKVCEYANFADSASPGTADSRNFASAKYEKEIRKLKTFKRQYEIENVGAVPDTQRRYWRIGGNRVGFGS